MIPRWRLRYLRGVVPEVRSASPARRADAADLGCTRPELLALLDVVGAERWVLPGGGAAVRVEADGCHHVLWAATDGDHRHAVLALWAAMPAGAPMLVHVPDWSAAAGLLDDAGFTEVDADTWCSTSEQDAVCSARTLGVHPGLAA